MTYTHMYCITTPVQSSMGVFNIQQDMLVGLNRNDSQGVRKVSDLHWTGSQYSLSKWSSSSPIRRIQGTGQFRACQFGKRARYRFWTRLFRFRPECRIRLHHVRSRLGRALSNRFDASVCHDRDVDARATEDKKARRCQK